MRKDDFLVTMELAREQMWRTLSMMKGGCNYRELAALSSTELVSILPRTANHYLINLHQAGYMRRTAEGKGFGREGIPARDRQNRSPTTDGPERRCDL